MAGFCESCGVPLNSRNACPVCEPASGAPASPQESEGAKSHPVQSGKGIKKDIGPLPPAHRFRRLLGSGIEFLVYAIALPFMSLAPGPGCLIFLVLIFLILMRDFNAGAFSIAKRVSRMKVVHWRSGQPAGKLQSFLRNSYYIVLLPVALVPVYGVVFWPIFLFFVAVDIIVLVASPQGRRLGDFLAGTQVVEQGG